MRKPKLLGASFRDPAGFIYKSANGKLLRQVNKIGAADYDLFLNSGLYKELVSKNLIVKHRRLDNKLAHNRKDAHAIIQPEVVPFISYPFEWSFSQLKDAALLTLKIQKIALKHGMTLKDASAYNVQFINGRPVFIDTLSFEKYQPGEPWQPYRQFCQHFLAPLSLMAYTDVDLSQLLRVQLDGINLALASKLLPARAKWRPSLAMHVVLHGRAQKAKQNDRQTTSKKVSQRALLGIIDSLERATKSLKPIKNSTEWGEYYDITNYSASAADNKAKLITQFAKSLRAKTALDLGGNNGKYSRVLNKLGILTVCSDIDPNAVEANYKFSKAKKETLMLPLLVDLTNPGGPLGWQNQERSPVQERLQTDLTMALALIHHLAISNNLPFSKISEYFKQFSPYLILEFVPKKDSQVQKLLSTRKDIFPDYDEENMVGAFSKDFKLLKEAKIKGSKRTLYLFKRK